MGADAGSRPRATATRGERFGVGLGAHLRAFLREPFHLVVLFVLPPLVVLGYGRAMESMPRLPFMDAPAGTLGYVNGAVFAAAFLAGLIGLFQVISARQSDHRLVVCGFGRTELFLSRLGTIVVVSVASAVVSFAVFAWQVDPASLLPAVGALALAALTYGLLGVLIGALVPRELEGSLVLVFVADMDDALASGMVDVETDLVQYTPLHYPHALFSDATLDGSVATGDVLGGVAYAVVLLVVVVAVYAHTTGSGGVGA
jgi:ABC-2 type transport system permease protein